MNLEHRPTSSQVRRSKARRNREERALTVAANDVLVGDRLQTRNREKSLLGDWLIECVSPEDFGGVKALHFSLANGVALYTLPETELEVLR